MGHRTDCILIPIEAFQECFRGLRRAGHHKDVFQLRKIDGKIVRRAFHTSHNRLCLPEVGLALCLARAPAARTSPGGTEWRSILRTVSRGDLYLDRLNKHHLARNLIHRLQRLGYTVALQQEAA
jgi:hypothetical protein